MDQPTPKSTRPGFVFPTRLVILLAIIIVLIICFNFKAPVVSKDIFIQIGGAEPTKYESISGTVEDALIEAGINVGSYDFINPDLSESLSDGMLITVVYAVPVYIVDAGEEKSVWTTETTVRDVLKKEGITLGNLDRVNPAINFDVSADLKIHITRVKEEYVEEFEKIPFKTDYWASPDLPKGQTRIQREGEEGLLKRIMKYVYENGVLAASPVLIESEVIKQPMNRIIGKGTREVTDVVETPQGLKEYKEIKRMEVTAYYPGELSTGEWADGYTFTGLMAGKGIVAVDPTVIPLGTKLYIPGYGEGIAADIGGAIKGNIIDVCFDTYQEAIHWGRQVLDIYILED
jgi:uncharacterized protein YabE (DUF348 family)